MLHKLWRADVLVSHIKEVGICLCLIAEREKPNAPKLVGVDQGHLDMNKTSPFLGWEGA